jgi:hypothetical protein
LQGQDRNHLNPGHIYEASKSYPLQRKNNHQVVVWKAKKRGKAQNANNGVACVRSSEWLKGDQTSGFHFKVFPDKVVLIILSTGDKNRLRSLEMFGHTIAAHFTNICTS